MAAMWQRRSPLASIAGESSSLTFPHIGAGPVLCAAARRLVETSPTPSVRQLGQQEELCEPRSPVEFTVG
ncbi:hypothetical protein NQZ68_004336 [Dissostichus eleginoides]|nr:hypothetical protein NQZ68_004336 [Dissostichus eleginoides]